MEERKRELRELRERIDASRYEIDPAAIAEAIIRRGVSPTLLHKAVPGPADLHGLRSELPISRIAHRSSRRAAQPLAA